MAWDNENVPSGGQQVPISEWHQRRVTDVKNSTGVFVIDGPQIVDQNYNTYPSAEWIDAFGWDTTDLY